MPERPAVPRDAAGRCGAAERIQIFEYPADPNAPASPVWHGWTDAGGDSSGLDAAGHPAGKTRVAASAEFEQRLAEEARRSFDAGREQGRQEERKALAGEQAQSLERQKRQMAALAESFAQARDRYLHAVEQEVVKLALAVAARILRREAQMDPLLLTGAVRVALGQLSASTEVQLRVPAGELDLWTEAIALLPNLPTKPAVVAGEGLRLGDCLIDTRLGTVDLGIRSQLGEIELGFFDRAGASRPEPALEARAEPHSSGAGRERRS
ncbi:MAG: FliH/SctL family protein [Terracidiphilus sp.]